MKTYVIIAVILCSFLTVCSNDGPSDGPNESHGAFTRLVGPIPHNADIDAYWWSGAGMDHTYIWKVTGVLVDFPSWWNEELLETYEGRRERHKSHAIYYFFDVEDQVIYYQWLNW